MTTEVIRVDRAEIEGWCVGGGALSYMDNRDEKNSFDPSYRARQSDLTKGYRNPRGVKGNWGDGSERYI